jgi:hypothetical protein
MKKIFASFGWILLLLPLLSVAGTKSIISTFKPLIQESDTREVSNFTGIMSSGSFEVHIKMGSTEDLRLEGDQEDIDNVQTKVENGVLIIKNKKNSANWTFMSNKVKVFITAKSLNSLTISGSGSMEVSGVIKSERLNAQVSGSGGMDISLATSTFNAAISGSGSVKASGSTKKSSVAISGSGGFRGKDLRTEVTDVRVSGSGSASVFADETLNASVSGSGGVSYSGNAKTNVSKSGSGSVRKN